MRRLLSWLARGGGWWAAGLAAALLIYAAAIRPWHLRWGATDEEVRERLPGDMLIPRPDLRATRAITIHAPASAVWPWLVQMGQARGGSLCITGLERLLGCDPRHPLPVAVLDPGRVLVLGNPAGMHPVRFSGGYFAASSAFVLREVDAQTSRLIVRFRADWSPTLLSLLAARGILEPANFLMVRKMLLGIRRRAEQTGA
ncbi:MAG TPA: hypothetical protein VFA33_19590 [Bryobacteraceae bacterium]|nr:hypothetical protein [Bryobacteraceae bacterium]